jgi:hypothetical protein
MADDLSSVRTHRYVHGVERVVRSPDSARSRES